MKKFIMDRKKNDMVIINRVQFKVSELNLSTKQRLTVNAVADMLLPIFREHIGHKNAITRKKLFKKVYGWYEDPESIKDYLRWDYIKKAMRLLRQRTKIFISFKYLKEQWSFFVVETRDDAEYFCDRVEKLQKRLTAAKKKARKAADENWADDENNWQLPEYNQKLLESQRVKDAKKVN